eukprot:246871-Rhodomonas_salina.2
MRMVMDDDPRHHHRGKLIRLGANSPGVLLSCRPGRADPGCDRRTERCHPRSMAAFNSWLLVGVVVVYVLASLAFCTSHSIHEPLRWSEWWE